MRKYLFGLFLLLTTTASAAPPLNCTTGSFICVIDVFGHPHAFPTGGAAGPAGPTGPVGATGATGAAGPAGTFAPTPNATGQIPISTNGSTFTLLSVGASGQCLVAAGSPLLPTWGSCGTGGGVTQTCTTWTPTDQSGAGLSLIITSATYCQTGKIVVFQTKLTWPTTVNSSSAQISAPVTATSVDQPLVLSQTTLSSLPMPQVNQTSITFNAPINGGFTNAQFSGQLLVIGGSYQTP